MKNYRINFADYNGDIVQWIEVKAESFARARIQGAVWNRHAFESKLDIHSVLERTETGWVSWDTVKKQRAAADARAT